MDASDIMDEQITDSSRSKTGGGSDDDFIVLSRSSVGGGGGDAPRAWNSVDSTSMPSPVRSYGCLSSIETDKATLDKAQNAHFAAIVSELDLALKRHTDNMLHAIDNLGARLTQMEARMRKLECSVDDMKHYIGNNHKSSGERMRHVDNILQEVQSGTQYQENKREVMDASLQSVKSQIFKAGRIAETQDAANVDPTPEVQSAAPQSQSLLPPPVVQGKRNQPSSPGITYPQQSQQSVTAVTLPPLLELPTSHHLEEVCVPSQTSPSNLNGVMVGGEDEIGISGSLVGATRKTLKEMHDLYCRHASSLGFSVRKNTSRRHPVDGIVREKYYCCSCEGKMNDKSDDVRKRKKRRVSVTRTGCGAFLRVKLNKSGEYEVVAHVTTHNHGMSRRE